MKKALVAALAISSIAIFSCTTGPKKTSKIPDRREFPVDPQVNACEDFFQHACGPALSNFQLREDRSRHIFSFNDSSERILEAKKAYLKSLLDVKSFNEKSQQLHD